MFDTTQVRHITLPLSGKKPQYESHLDAELCGETCFRCLRVQIWDVLELFSFRCQPFPESRTIVYPHHMRMQLALSQAAIGAANSDGLMQNRRGNDPTETFDIREYAPGDDIRSIHWKLSCKTDMLIVRQPSDPSQYDVVVLPDLGKTQDGAPTSAQELNAAASLVSEVGEQLLKLGVAFCMAIPTGKGLQLREVRDERDMERILPEWLSMRVSQNSGDGLKYFLIDHLEEHFTRLIVLSAGKYAIGVDGLGRRGGTLVISAVADTDVVRADSSGGCQIIELPAEQPADQIYRILC